MAPERQSLLLCYHALSEGWPSALAVRPADFAEQVAAFVKLGYRFTTFHDAVRGQADGRVCAITFDDAYLSTLKHAFPVLQELGLVATVFVPTAKIATAEPLSWPGIEEWLGSRWEGELTSMSWDELRDLAAAGWEIGSHTRTHPHLPEIDAEHLGLELGGSRATCEAELGKPCRTIAYPYGDYDSRVIEAAAAAGYEAGATLVSSIPSSDVRNAHLQRPRVAVYRDDGLRRIKAKAALMAKHPAAWNAAAAFRSHLRH